LTPTTSAKPPGSLVILRQLSDFSVRLQASEVSRYRALWHARSQSELDNCWYRYNHVQEELDEVATVITVLMFELRQLGHGEEIDRIHHSMLGRTTQARKAAALRYNAWLRKRGRKPIGGEGGVLNADRYGELVT
jgi:hypothetical protein